jgi:hypothetical protein
MKALTINQPWAEMICRGLKRVENRTWPTNYRGPLAIHVGKSLAWLKAQDACTWPAQYGVDALGFQDDGRIDGGGDELLWSHAAIMPHGGWGWETRDYRFHRFGHPFPGVAWVSGSLALPTMPISAILRRGTWSK